MGRQYSVVRRGSCRGAEGNQVSCKRLRRDGLGNRGNAEQRDERRTAGIAAADGRCGDASADVATRDAAAAIAAGRSNEREACEFIRPNDRLSSFERLEIYNRQYWFRLFSSFEEDFPGVQAIVGRNGFRR